VLLGVDCAVIGAIEVAGSTGEVVDECPALGDGLAIAGA
jgi:hypothetical protein